jgi:hypothetical protein
MENNQSQLFCYPHFKIVNQIISKFHGENNGRASKIPELSLSIYECSLSYHYLV